MPDRATVLAVPDAHLHDYGKAPRARRKLGHVTLRAPDEKTLAERLAILKPKIWPG
jgi:5-(carboxyamino)imidazole ribonucleotide synthase